MTLIRSSQFMLIFLLAGWQGAPSLMAAELGRADSAIDDYQPGPDSLPQPEVPAGQTFEFRFDHSKIFPGTTRTISVYVPAQYRAETPACVYVALDGLGFSASTVFDNLIYQKAIPVLIAVGISPGEVPSARPPANPRFNRSYEFDGLNDRLARFILEEILPEVERHRTADGRVIRLSRDANDRCTAGASTGAIAAFTLAWEHPEEFHRVFSAIGTYVGMRGGDRYPVLIRKTEPKPVRIFLQDGSNDQWAGGPEVGDWWISNQAMLRSLEFAGYEVNHDWGTGVHSPRHATAIFPEAMRWLWKDWPRPLKAGISQNTFLQSILRPGESWEIVTSGHPDIAALAVDQKGRVFFKDGSRTKTWGIDASSEVRLAPEFAGNGDAAAFGADGQFYVMDALDGRLLKIGAAGTSSVIAQGIYGHHFVVTHTGAIYATEADKLWLINAGGKKILLDSGLAGASGIVLSPDGLWLAVTVPGTNRGYSYRVQPDGTLEAREDFYWLHAPDWAEDSGAGDWCTDREGLLYAATRMGIQIVDHNGRVRAILPLPAGPANGVCFGGENFDTLYVASAGTLYRRKLKSQGAPAWLPLVNIPSWGAG